MFLRSLVTVGLIVAVAGCSGERTAETDGDAETSANQTDVPQESPLTDEFTKPRVGDADAATTTGDAGSSETPVNRITLGSPELTSGIQGEGSLTPEQIQTWIDNPGNHVTLEVKLPLGLAAGANAITIPDNNPLTLAKIELGRQLYFDRRLSADRTVSCADCHHPDEGFGRHTQFGVGINGQTGGRNSPISYNRILSGAQFWDGRAGSLEAQAVGPIASPIEMGNTHEAAVETVKSIAGYLLQFERIFDDGVTIDNIGKAIASMERVIVTGPSPFDYYESFQRFATLSDEELTEIREDDADIYAEYQTLQTATKEHPLSEIAIRGRELFFGKKVNCSACHVGANLTDEKYHNLGVGMDVDQPDLGRYEVTKDEKDRGAFKTPTIRNVALSAPYMHDGGMQTLEQVVEHYNKGGTPNAHLSEKIVKLNLNDQQKADLVEFMKACTGEFPHIETERLPQ